MRVYNDELILGGALYVPGLTQNSSVLRWTGSFLEMGAGLQHGRAWTMTHHDNELIVGGEFAKSGDIVTAFWARWRPECPRGDMDCDQAVNEADIATFVSVLLAPAAATDCQRYLADVTADGDVNGADVSAFVAALKM